MTKRRALVIPLISLVMAVALIGMATPALAAGGDFSLDFVAAGPFTYNHATGVGGEFADRTISKTDGVVESLEGGDFECGDRVVYFTEITVDAGATGSQDIELDYGWLAEPTGQPGVGQTDLISASPNTGDSGMSGGTADTTASIKPNTEHIDTGGPKDELQATIQINNLDPGEVFILRLVVLLTCTTNSSPTGDLQAEIHAGRVVAPAEDVIPVGNQTVPFKSVASVTQPSNVSVTVGPCPAPGSPTRPVEVSINPSGSAVLTITGPGGPYVVSGSGDTLNLAPGNYSWTAVAEPGFELTGSTSGQFTVGTCPKIPSSVDVSVGACPRPGSPTRPVTVTIDPPGSATVTIEGPGGPYVVTGDGDTLNLPAGDYTWTAEADAQHQLDVSSGEFTVAECPRIPASVGITVGPCPAPGSPTRPVDVVIDPSGSATVTIEGPGGPYVVTGDGDTLNLAPGDYTWTAVADDEHSLEVSSGEFTVESCPAIEASVLVTVGACPSTSSATRPVDVAIVPDGGADVTVTGPNGFNAVVTGAGDTLDLGPGTYNWSAVANETFELIGATEGTFKVAGCIVEVLPKTILPSTGSGVTGLGVAGAVFVLFGCVLVAASFRPATATVSGWNRMAVLDRLSGRSTAARPQAWMLTLVSSLRSVFPTGRARRNADRRGQERARP
jgi:hypothetical protein